MIHFYTLTSRTPVRTTANDSSVQWLHVEKPSPEEITELQKIYDLPKDYITAVLDDAENSRHEGLQQVDFTNAFLLLLQFPHAALSSNGFMQYTTYPLAVIFTPSRQIITISNYPPVFLDSFSNWKMTKEADSPELALAFQILWELVLSFNHYLKKIKEQLLLLENQIKVSTENKQLYQMLDIQKSLVLIESATKNNYTTLQAFAKVHFLKEQSHLTNAMQDILIEIKQAMTSATIHLKLVDQMTNTFSAIVSNNLNNVMKILTSITLVLTIPTIIGGIYGMNVALPFADSKGAFWLIAFSTILLCILAIRYLKKKNLL